MYDLLHDREFLILCSQEEHYTYSSIRPKYDRVPFRQIFGKLSKKTFNVKLDILLNIYYATKFTASSDGIGDKS